MEASQPAATSHNQANCPTVKYTRGAAPSAFSTRRGWVFCFSSWLQQPAVLLVLLLGSMRRISLLPAPAVQLLLVLGAAAVAAPTAAALQLELSNLSAESAPAYTWDVSSSLTSAANITLYANETGLATFRVDVRRRAAGAAYFVAGTLSATNPADAPGPAQVSAYRLLLAPGFFGPAPKALPDCAAGELQPGQTASCDFRLQLASGGASSVAPGATLRGAPAVAGTSSPLSFPPLSDDDGGDETDATASDSNDDGSGSSSRGGDSGCAVISDAIQAGAAAAAFTTAASTSTDGGALLQPGGARVCGESTVFKYAMQVGPFDGLDGVCGAYKFSNRPQVQLLGYGSSSITAAAGQLTIGGCRQRDVLGLLKPAISISTLTVARVTKYTWAASTSATAAEAAKTAATAAAAGGPDAATGKADDALADATGDALAASAFVAFNGSLAVTSTLQLNRSSSAQNALIGEVTLTNTEVVPYVLAGVRLVITPKQGRSSSASSNTSKTAPTAAATAARQQQQPPQQQLIVNVSCPLEQAAGSIVVPPQLLAGLPGTLRCAFELPLNASWEAGMLQAQARTLLSKESDIDSGQPQPYDFASNASAMEVGGCVAVWGRRITPAAADASGGGGNAALPAVEQAGSADVESVLALARTHGYKLAPAPARVTGGRAPPAPGGLLAVPLTVCANRSLQWTEVHGPFTRLDCGSSLSVLALNIKPRGGGQPDINTTIAYPLTVTGCGMVPELAMQQLAPSAKKVFSWSVERRVTPADGLSLGYSTQEVVKYNITYNRSFAITGRRLQGVVRMTNPHATPLIISRVSYSLSRPAGKAALTGPAVCSSDAASAADAASQLFGEQQAQPPQQPFTLPASPTAVAAQMAEAAASKAASGNGGGGLFGLLRSNSNSRGLAAADADGAGASSVPGSSDNPDVAADAAAGTPPEAYCSFVLAVSDGDAAQVAVHALTDDGEQGSVQAAVDWKAAQLFEFGKCALVAAAFQQTQPATLLQPVSVSGSMPPGPEAAVQVCAPTKYTFWATFGPFKEDECGSRQAIAVAAVSVPGLQNLTQVDATTAISVMGCPDRLPLLALQPPTPSQVTTSYEWAIEHSLTPLSSAAAAAAPPGARTAAPSAVTVSDPGGWALFNQTVAFKRSKPVQHRRRYQLRGSVSLVNANDKPQALSSLQLRVSRPGGQGEPLAAVEARCPRVTPVGAKAGASSSAQQQQAAAPGVVLLPPAGGKPVVCNYSVLLTDVQPASGSSGPVVEVVAVAVLAADGRRAKSGPPARVELADVKPVTLGWCAKVSEAQQLLPGTDGDAAAAAAAALPDGGPSFVGARVPPAGEVLCGPKTYQMLGQLGPLKPAAQANARGSASSSGGSGSVGGPGCGSVSYVSAVTLEPTSGFQPKQRASRQLDVVFEGCDDV